MISSLISRASAGLLLLAGLVMLFASDVVMPRLVAGYPVSGAWVGQILGGAASPGPLRARLPGEPQRARGAVTARRSPQ